MAFFPLAYITLSSVLKAISPNLELAAQNLGARGFHLFRTITWKLATPGLASAFILVGINALADFGNPMLVGGNYKVLATEAYGQVTGAWNLQLGAALSVLLVIPTILIFFVQRYYLEKRSYVTVTGKPTAGLKRITVSASTRWLLFTFCYLLSTGILLMIGIVVGFACTANFGGDFSFTNRHLYEGIVNSKAISNSWLLCLIAAIITTVLGTALAWVVRRRKFIGRGLLDFTAMLPVSLPGTFIGLSLVLAYNTGWIAMTGTASIIIVGMCVRQLPDCGYESWNYSSGRHTGRNLLFTTNTFCC